jgi:hypothetical protein
MALKRGASYIGWIPTHEPPGLTAENCLIVTGEFAAGCAGCEGCEYWTYTELESGETRHSCAVRCRIQLLPAATMLLNQPISHYTVSPLSILRLPQILCGAKRGRVVDDVVCCAVLCCADCAVLCCAALRCAALCACVVRVCAGGVLRCWEQYGRTEWKCVPEVKMCVPGKGSGLNATACADACGS